MSHERPTIGDIQTAELVYYDPDFITECYRFCEIRDIDCLPEIGDDNSYHQRIDAKKRFEKTTISDDRKLDGATFLFQRGLLERFKKHAVQFVYNNGELTGVVHFSDYNRDVVSAYLFGQFARYEHDLRELAARCGLTNQDMIEHLRIMAEKARKNEKEGLRLDFEARIAKFEEKREELARLPEFQSFYLMELIGLSNRKKVIRLNDQVNILRNLIMHVGTLVEMEDANTPDYIYKIDSFIKFFENVVLLLKDGRRIRNRLIIKRELSRDLQQQ